MFAARVHTGDIDLFPLNGDVVGFEDGLDGFGDLGSDTVTWMRDSVLAVVLALHHKLPGRCVPGIKVTVYFPPYLVGLKISDSTVA